MAVTSCTKWSCPACTYNNWPSCTKCVLCGVNKPSDDVIPRIPVAKYRQQNTGWSKLSPSSNPPTGSVPFSQPKLTQQERNNSSILESSPTLSSTHAHGYAGQQPTKTTSKCKTKGKWTCSTCTYINWPNSGQCVMCSSNRVKGCRNEPSSIRNEGLSRLSSTRLSPSSYDSILSYASGIESEGVVDSAVHGGEIPNLFNTKARSGRNSNRGNGSSSESKKKWRCSYCTYDNSPGLTKCSMCQYARGRTPTPPLAAGVGVEQPSGTTPSPPPPIHIPHRSPPTSSQNHQQSSSSRLPIITTSESSSSSISSSSSSSSSSTSKPQGNVTTNSNAVFSSYSSGIHSQHNSKKETVDYGKMAQGTGNDVSCNVHPVAGSAMSDSGCGSSRERRGQNSAFGLRQLQLNNVTDEVRQIRNTLSSSDWLFLNACLAIVNDDEAPVKAYLRQDGDKARQLTKDQCLVLGPTFSVGSTLVHLAIRFQRSELLSLLLTPAHSDARKRLPSESNIDLASSIREEVCRSLLQHKGGDWPCYYTTQLNTFILPNEIRRFCSAVQKRVLDEIVDKDVSRELEADPGIINWSCELVQDMDSRLYPLWNRTAGDCLLDSVLQASWGVVDRDSTLRRAMADSLAEGDSSFYERWKYSEQRQSKSQGFTLEEVQLRQDWSVVVALADQTGRALEQMHVFVLAHVLRRPIIVYGVRVVKNYRGENLGYANFEGVYLPLLWESSFCYKTPLALAYTRGHFSALVPLSTVALHPEEDSCHITYLPLVDSAGHLFSVHYLSEQELGSEERLIEEYCDCHITRLRTLTAKQEVMSNEQHSLVLSLVDQWLDRFRKMDKRREAAATPGSHLDYDHTP